MSVMTRPPGQRGPANRLPHLADPRGRGAEIRLGLAGVLGIALLVVGIPAALVLFVGYPLPRSAPSKDWLTASITATLVIKILACVVWLVWAHFVVCLLAEWRAVRRGRLPGGVLLGGGSQLLARRLIAAALLLGGAATAIPHSAASSAAGLLRPPVTAHHATVHAPADNGAAADTHGGQAERDAEAARPRKYYIVQPPHGRRYDCLWDIAERTLKDPLRYREIFALNKERVQSDGRKLVDANLILPGWQLWLPADASGPGVHTVLARAPNAAPRPDPKSPARHADGTGGETATSGTAAHPASTAPASRDENRTGEIALGGALMLAGVLVALSARRGPYAAPAADEQALSLGADPGLAADLDRALRTLAALRSDQRRPLPQPIVAWADAETVVLNLAGGDAAEPPAPWVADVSDVAGRTWTCRFAELPDHPRLADTAAPYPGLLSVGRHDGWELFVDFEQAPGIVAVAGDPTVARDAVAALAVQAATTFWSDGARVVLVGFADGAQLAQVAPDCISHVDRLDAVLPELTQQRDHVLGLQRQLAVDGVLTGRQARRDALWRPTFLLLSGPPSAHEAEQLQALVGAGRSNVVAMMVGDLPAARWRFVAESGGRIDLGVLGARAQAHRLGYVGAAQLGELLAEAERHKQAQTRAVAELTPAAAVAASAEAVSAPVRHAPSAPPTATVSLLGPVTVTAPGPIDPARQALATEIVVAVALHANGVHEAVLRASIWPRGVSDGVYAAALAETQRWLGDDAHGRPNLVLDNGRWLLGEDVLLDADELRRLAAACSGATELETLLRAIALFRGKAFSDVAPGRYGWLAFARAGHDARLVGTAVTRRAAALLVERGDTARAEQVLRHGLLLIPESEPLWRDLLVLTGGQGPGPAAAAVDEMYATLHTLRIWPDPETDALAAQVAPARQAPQIA